MVVDSKEVVLAQLAVTGLGGKCGSYERRGRIGEINDDGALFVPERRRMGLV